MAENQDGQEKTEEPSGKRLSDARERGQIPRSRELNSFLLMLSGSLFLYVAGGALVEKFAALFKSGLAIERAVIFDHSLQIKALGDFVLTGIFIIVPLLAILAAVAILSSTLISGWNFSTDSIGFKWERISPLKGLKRVFGVHGLVELVKSAIKFVLLGCVAVTAIWHFREEILALGRMPLETALAETGRMSVLLFLILSVSIVLVAAVDVPFQIWNHRRQLRMTHQELKDEHKQTEGSPETRARIRRAQAEAARKRMMAAIPKADVVITNPTHFAVALMYDQKTQKAPRVVAKGKDFVAQMIRESAIKHHVPILQAAPLARALYYSTDIGHEIPAGLYYAVAKVLAYVFELRRRYGRGRVHPSEMNDIEIPDEYYHEEET